jgi:hypothetical protein
MSSNITFAIKDNLKFKFAEFLQTFVWKRISWEMLGQKHLRTPTNKLTWIRYDKEYDK